MTTTKAKRRKGFDQLRREIDSDPARRMRVEEHKAAMLGELRRNLDLTQIEVAERLEVTQESVSHIERGDDLRLSTLDRYVAALGGRLELRAAFPGETVPLNISGTRASERRRVKTSQTSVLPGSRTNKQKTRGAKMRSAGKSRRPATPRSRAK
jgi:transcriptional regulator with XRE-family HTH domain